MSYLEVNGAAISPGAVRAEAARLRLEASQAGRELSLEDALEISIEAEELLIERVLLDQEAERLGIALEQDEWSAALATVPPGSEPVTACRADLRTPEVRADIERRLRVDKLVDVWTKDLKPPSSKLVRQFYLENRDRFWMPESIFVVQIVKNVHHESERAEARTTLERIALELDRGADFSALATIHSDCPGQGGALGFVRRGEMVPEFEEIVFDLPLNRASPVFETRFGFHIAKVSQRRDAGILPFSDAAPYIAELLQNLARERELESRIGDLRSRASIRRVST